MLIENKQRYDSPVPRVLIADDHVIVRRGIQRILRSGFLALEFGEVGNGHAVLDAVSGGHWDLLILDLALPGRSGLDIMPELRRLAPDLKVLVLTMHTEEQYALRLFRSGASGYLTKDSPPDKLIEAATRVMAGGKYLSPAMAERLAEALDAAYTQPPHETLSMREFEVMRLIASGVGRAQIATALTISPKSVSTYRVRILKKLNLATIHQMIVYAHRNGFVDWPQRQLASYVVETIIT